MRTKLVNIVASVFLHDVDVFVKWRQLFLVLALLDFTISCNLQ